MAFSNVGNLLTAFQPSIARGSPYFASPRQAMVPLTTEHRDEFVARTREVQAAAELYSHRLPEDMATQDQWYQKKNHRPLDFGYPHSYEHLFRKLSGAEVMVAGNAGYRSVTVAQSNRRYFLGQTTTIPLQDGPAGSIHYRMHWPTPALHEFFGLPKKATRIENALGVASVLLLDSKQFGTSCQDAITLTDTTSEQEVPVFVYRNLIANQLDNPTPYSIRIVTTQWQGQKRSQLERPPLTVTVSGSRTSVELSRSAHKPWPLKISIQFLWRTIEGKMRLKPWGVG